MKKLLGISLTGLLAVMSGNPAAAAELERLKYHHPGLVVDLGVGLWAWPLPMDFDGDGDLDLVVNCPDKPSNGVYFFENTSGDTAKNKMPVFKPGRRISQGMQNVQLSWDKDGQPIVMTPGHIYPDFRKTGLENGVALPLPENVHPRRVRANMWRMVDYDGDGKLDIIVGVGDWTEYGWDNAYDARGRWMNGPLRGYVYWLHNIGTEDAPQYAPAEKVMAGDRPVEVYGWPSPNFADFDGDGDLDLLCGEFLDGFTYFKNIGTRDRPQYAPGKRLKTGDGAYLTMDLQMITPTAIDWDKDGDLDLIVGDEDGRVAFVENTGQFDSDGIPIFAPPRYFQQEADEVKFGALATPYGYDWDGDGDMDILCGNTAGYIAFIENLSGPGVERPRFAAPRKLEAGGEVIRIMAGPNGSIQGPCEAKWGYTTLTVADWDGDRLPDLIVNSIWGKVVWYRNIGTRTAPRLAPAQPIEVEWDGPAPRLPYGWLQPEGKALLTQWRTTPVVTDWNFDGLPDLLMLDHEGYLAFFEREEHEGQRRLKAPRRVLLADPKVTATPKAFEAKPGDPLRLNSKIGGGSGRRKLCVTDWDGDGRLDILVNGPNAYFLRQIRDVEDAWYFQDMGLISPTNIEGHDVSPTVVDFDGNGIPDFLGGAEDGRLYYLRNPRAAQAPATAAVPASPAIVKGEFIYETGSYPQVHASTIAETPEGLVAAWFGGTREKHPDVGIWVSRYENGRWTPSVEVAHGVQYHRPDGSVHRHPTWNPVLFQPADGPLMLFYKAGPNPDAWWGMLTTSPDHGRTWEEPRRLPEGIIGPVKNKPVQLADGSLLCPSSEETPDEPSRWTIHFERTTNFGKTWERTPALHDGLKIQAIQPSILQLPGNRLLAIGRTRQNRIFEVESTDGGRTWGEVKLGSLPNNNSGTDACTLADGRHLLVYNHAEGEPGQWGGKRTPLNVAVSTDGRNWQAALVLESDPGEFSYPAVIQTRDGLVHITYTWNRKRVKHIVIDPAKLQPRDYVNGTWPQESSRR